MALLGTASTAGTALVEGNRLSLCNICIYHQVLAAGRLSEILCFNVRWCNGAAFTLVSPRDGT